MTRCLGIMENILKTSEYNLYVVCDKKQNDFTRIYLAKYKHRIVYKDMITDVGFVNKENSLEVDKNHLQQKLLSFTSTWDKVVDGECNFLRNINIESIITDISPIGCLVGNKLNLPVILISNFTWVEQYEFIKIEDSIINKFRQAYSNVNKFIKYDLCLPVSTINCNEVYGPGFICREIDYDKVEYIKKKYGKSIFITCGKSVSLNNINIKNFDGTIFITSGITINYEGNCNVINLPVDILDTQNYIAASHMVISKNGWGTSIIGHTNLVLIERPTAKEDTYNIEKIKANKLAISIKERDLSTIDILSLE